jgi:glycosyltransferase involved in cell wall biosynthesis
MTSDHEGLPMALLQAMCLQKTVVCTAVGGIPEVIESGRSGILVDANDREAFVAACLSVLWDQNMASTLGRAAREEVLSRFDVSSHADSVSRLYQRLCYAE